MTRKERFAGIVDWFEKNVPIAETELHYGNPYPSSCRPSARTGG